MKKIIISVLLTVSLCSCGKTQDISDFSTSSNKNSMELKYAEQFTVDYNENGNAVVTIGGDEKYLLLPEGETADNDDVTVINIPVENIYLASSSVMDLFYSLDSLDSVKFTSTDENNWGLDYVTSAINNGDIQYAGKYRTPDFEMLISGNCGLALENTMIYHTPEIKEQLENLDIPVMVERSSYESHPLGRMEWVKLYGLLTGKEKEAEEFFNSNAEKVENLEIQQTGEKKKIAFFYVSSNGYVNIRKPDDYVSRMIELAGGEYIFTAEDLSVEENALSTMNIDLELFYEKAKDADIIIYNSTIGGEPESGQQLLEQCPLIADFNAYHEGNAWYTDKNMFQQTSAVADMIKELNLIISGENEKDEYFHHIEPTE